MGGAYVNGKALSESVRRQIVEMSQNNIRACDIAKQLKVSHGCVSKLLKKYRNTGSYKAGSTGGSKPKVAVPEVVKMIMGYKDENPTIFAWEIRERLIKERKVTKFNIPSISSINRILRINPSDTTRRSSLGSSSSPSSSESSVSPPILVKRSPVGYSINAILGHQNAPENSEVSSTPIMPQLRKRKFGEIDDGDDILKIAVKSARLIEEDEPPEKTTEKSDSTGCSLPAAPQPPTTDLCKDLGSLLDMLPWVPSQISSFKSNPANQLDDSFASLIGSNKGTLGKDIQENQTAPDEKEQHQLHAVDISKSSVPKIEMFHTSLPAVQPHESSYSQQKSQTSETTVPRPVPSFTCSSGAVPNNRPVPSTPFYPVPSCSQPFITGLPSYSYPSYVPPPYVTNQRSLYPATSFSSDPLASAFHAPISTYTGYPSSSYPYFYQQ
ncbi:paired box protein Pax-9-like [Ostrea edulis]|uniref:paired box protein Pax-9-like n=1 Tax=Ostrea edulis TaxID=37623 RepID=UPI0024AEE0B8|nr:paired box protein Pax-9-like [Ostrea edulis]